MATLEKYKYYSQLLIQYTLTRFGILKFAAFAMLLVILGASVNSTWLIHLVSFVFVLVTLFIFRMLDDAWSFYYDRKYFPDRSYILPENLKGFVLSTIVFITIYLIALIALSTYLFFVILTLICISTVLYLLFYKNELIMKIIPLLKYPIIIWCISGLSVDVNIIAFSSGAFFMMLAFDYFDLYPTRKEKVIFKILVFLIAGLLIIQPWNGNLFLKLILVLIPLFHFVIPDSKFYKYFPVIVFPLIHLIDIISQL